MPSILKAPKVLSSKKKPTKLEKGKGKGKVVPENIPVVESSEEDEDEDEDEEGSDDGGVDGEGMERLMKVLGEDGIDEFERAQLQILGGEEDEEWETDAGEEEGEIALDDVDDSVDEDAVPRQKIEIDNKVRDLQLTAPLDTNRFSGGP